VLLEGSSPSFVDCTFTANEAIQGGALAVDAAAPAFVGCRFESNLASEGGGALYTFDGAPSLTRCDLIDNEATAGFGGAVLAYFGSMIELESCTLADNRAGTDGGAIYATNSSLATLTGSVVCGNTLEQLRGPVEFGAMTCVQETCDACPPVTCPADLDGDAIVDGADLNLLLGEWGQAGGLADITEDGIVDGADLNVLLGEWGVCP
jgi:predicted outer membrane repeat protein